MSPTVLENCIKIWIDLFKINTTDRMELNECMI